MTIETQATRPVIKSLHGRSFLKELDFSSDELGALIDLVLIGEDDSEDGQLRTELEATLDSAALELFCGGLMESWEEGLEGIFAVAI